MARKAVSEKALPYVDPSAFDREAVFGAIGYKPDAWQSLFHASKARNRILACGIRVGKTFCLAAEATAAAICPSSKSNELNEYVGSRGWILAPNYDLADRLFLQVLKNLRRYAPKWIESYSERDRIIRTIGGGIIQGKTAENLDSLTGEELDWLIIDEAGRVPELAMENARERLLTRNGWMAAISSPTPCKWFARAFEMGQGSGYNYEFRGEPKPGFRYAGLEVEFVPGKGAPDPSYFSIMVPTHANRRIDQDFLADMERTTPERVFRQDYLAEFMSKDGNVFSGFERLATATRLTDALPGHRYVIAWDVARTKDYSVVVVMDYNTREQVFQDRFQGPWDVQMHRVESICRRFNRPDLLIDATGKGDPVAEEMQRRNIDAGVRAATPRPGQPEDRYGPFAQRIEGIQLYSNVVKREIVENLAVGFDQGLLRILPDPVLLQELRLYEYKQADATGIVRYGAPPGFHDDCVMALALAWRRCSAPIGTALFIMR